MTKIFKNSHCDLDLDPIMLEGKRDDNLFLKKTHCDLDLGPKTPKFKIVQAIAILHICVKLS